MDLGTPRYASNGGVALAHQTIGDGPVDLLLLLEWVLPWESFGAEPRMARFLRRVSSFARVILFDRRGVGQSDPISAADPPTLEQWVADAVTVLDAVDSSRAFVLGSDLGGMVGCLLAAMHPDRTEGLVLVNSFPTGGATPEVPWGAGEDDVANILGAIATMWGRGFPPAEVLAPSLAPDDPFHAWAQSAQRRGASPSTARTIMEMAFGSDVCDILPAIRVPTLVMHSRGNRMASVENGRYLARHIPDSTYVEMPGSDHSVCLTDAAQILDELEEMATGARRGVDVDRVVASVVFTDIVGSTERVVELGDRRWRALLDQHDQLVRTELLRFNGREVKATGDGFMASFDGPARAVQCAYAIIDSVKAIGLDVRAGVHTGECEVRADDLGGLAVHIAARVGAAAGPGEVWVSHVVPGLSAGAGITFVERGSHVLKGIPGEWPLYAAVP
jgi:pimeloyl-ACP methyl ester carboxylesterase